MHQVSADPDAVDAKADALAAVEGLGPVCLKPRHEANGEACRRKGRVGLAKGGLVTATWVVNEEAFVNENAFEKCESFLNILRKFDGSTKIVKHFKLDTGGGPFGTGLAAGGSAGC